MSVAAASRNAILSRYNHVRRQQRHLSDAAQQDAKRKRYMNVRALTLHKNPGFVTAEGTGAKPKLIIDEEAVATYIAQHKEDLEAEIRKGKQELEVMTAFKQLPYSWSQWNEWLTEHDDFLQDSLREACPTRT